MLLFHRIRNREMFPLSIWTHEIWIIVLLIQTCHCFEDNKSSESYLIRHILMKNHDPLVRPVADSSQPTNLNLSMGMKGVIELNMKQQALVSFAWFCVTWYDEFLRWDVDQYPNQEVQLQLDMVWRPDLVIFNTLGALDEMEDQKIKVIVQHTGRVIWYPGGLYVTSCAVNIFYYPLDTQTCSVKITTWSSTMSSLNAALGDPAFETTSEPISHPEWELVSRTADVNVVSKYYWHVRFTFILERKVIFYVLNMILPILFLSLMNSVVFLLPSDTGEKMTVSVTIFLSYTVFLSNINTSLPSNSDSVCLFSVFVATEMFVSVCSIFLAACIVFLYGEDQGCRVAAQNDNVDTSSRKPNTEALPDVQNPVVYSTNTSLFCYTQFSESTYFLPPGTTDGRKQEDSDSSGSVQRASANLSVKLVWFMVRRFRHLKPHERRLLSQQLDTICFRLVSGVNIIICFIFWIFIAGL